MLPDDNLSGVIPGIRRPPEICVDYLSHEWTKEDDLWTSWKMMSKQKNEIANGVRLENASWRSWTKQKYHLKTVNPEKLNWMKDGDVTWLYGPLHTAWTPPEVEENGSKSSGLIQHSYNNGCHKSCLKKRSISEALLPNLGRRYPSLVSSHSDTQLYQKKKRDDTKDCFPNESTTLATSISEPTLKSSPSETLAERHHEQHIRFNDQVEQCIAVDSIDDDVTNDDDESDNSSSSDDGAIIMKNSRKVQSKKKDCSIICKLAPTRLKSDRLHSNELPALQTNNDSDMTSTTIQEDNETTIPPTTTSTYSPVYHASWDDDDDDDEGDDLVNMGGLFPFDSLDESFRDDDRDGIVERAVHLATGVVHWWTMVFNGQVSQQSA